MPTWNLSKTYAHILICNGSSCMREGAEDVTKAIRQQLKEHRLNDYIHTSRTRCNGRCEDACTVIVYPEGTWYQQMTPEDAKPFIQAISQKAIYAKKVSHTFVDGHFQQENHAAIGRLRSEKKETTAGKK